MSLRITEEQKTLAVEAFEQDGNMVKAAQAADVNVRTLYREQNRDKVFKKALAEADLIYHEHLKDAVRDAAKNPDLRMPQLYAIMFEIKKHLPEYRDKFTADVEANINIITTTPRPPKKEKEE